MPARQHYICAVTINSSGNARQATALFEETSRSGNPVNLAKR